MPTTAKEDDREVLSVSQLTREVREALESRIGTVWVEGEVSNHRLQSSGHHYFTLKDASSQLSCVLFRGAAARIFTRIADGVLLQVHGDISVYEPRGQYQMIVRQVQARGQGSLQAQFEALKRKLHGEGLFDEERKKPIPRLPGTVALVTSPTGAAIRDMLHILARRAPWLRILIYPVRVQGAGAEQEIIRALHLLDHAADYGLPAPDTIVIGRGGGSLEDLWCFNEESLARAIATHRTPIISAVGHEIDFTISDFVADLRAPTPSAAAEMLTPDAAELHRQLGQAARLLQSRSRQRLEHQQQLIELIGKGSLLHEPRRRLTEATQQLDDAESMLQQSVRESLRRRLEELQSHAQTLAARHPRVQLIELEHRTATQQQRLTQSLAHRLDRLADLLRARGEVLRHLGPQSVLSRGFSYTTDEAGCVLEDASQAAAGQTLITRLAKGSLRSTITELTTASEA
jgi:exodeoxyribonuclease VII large subunit